MKHSNFSKVLSLALCLCMLLGTVSISAFAVNYDETKLNPTDDYYNVISKKDWNNAPGITETEIVLNNDAGNRRQILHLMEVDMNNEYTKATTSYAKLDPTGIIPKSKYEVADEYAQALYMQDVLGYNVIGAMNTCLSWYNGTRYSNDSSLVNEPLGIMMIDGVVISDTCVGFPTCVVIYEDNTVKMQTINSVADIPEGAVQVIPCSSGYIVKDGVNQYSVNHGTDTAPRSVVGITADNHIIMFENDGRQAPTSEGMTMYELAEVMIAAGCTYACNCDGGGSSTYVSKRPGEELKVNNVPSDGFLRSTTSGIVFISTAPASDALYQATVTAPAEYYTPGSSVQFTAVGSNMLGDGVDIPAEAEWVLADPSFGTIDENGLFVSNGTTGTVTAQLVYENEVKGSEDVNIVVPEFGFKVAKLVLPYGETSTINIDVTTNGGLNTVVTKPGDIVLTLSDAGMGTIDGMAFTTTADTAVTGGTLTATGWGTEKNIEVKFGKASEVVYDFENNYEFFEDTSLNGAIDGDTNNNSWDNYIKGWHIADQKINMNYGFRNQAVKTYSPVGCSCDYNVYKVDSENGFVRNGDYAMAVHWDCTSRTMAGPAQFDVHFPEMIDVSEATQFGFWMYLPDFDNMNQTSCWTVRFVGMDANKSGFINVTKVLTAFTADAKICDNGWIYISVDTIANNMAYMSHLHFYPQDAKGNVNPYTDMTFYIDDITVDYSDAVIDREIPYFTSLGIANEFDSADEINGQTITSNTINLVAEAKENTAKENASGLNMASAKMNVDGVELSGITTTAAGRIVASNVTLTNGTHTIRAEISDNQGNTSSITRKLTVNGESETIKLVPAENYNKVFTGSVVYFNLVADDIENIDSVTVKINLDETNKWELEGMTTAYGFDADYKINANQDLVLTLTRNGDKVADTNILATLPVRVWMTNAYLNQKYIDTGYVTNDPAKQDKYWVLNPYAMWVTDGVTIIHVIADASEGLVTFTDGTTEGFSSVKYDITTEMNRYRNTKNDGDANFYQNKASFHVHEAGEPQNKAASCTESGYTGRVFCVGCTCEDGIIASDTKTYTCDCPDGCGSVITWGETIPATGHNYKLVEGKFICDCGDEYETGTGLFEINGNTYCSIAGNLVSGWQLLDEWYYFDPETFTTVETLNNGFVTYEFEKDGMLVSGQWYKDDKGTKYYYGPDCYNANTSTVAFEIVEIDGDSYVFGKNGYMYTGAHILAYATRTHVYDCGVDGKVHEITSGTGLLGIGTSNLIYVKDGKPFAAGLVKTEDGDYYFIKKGGTGVVNKYVEVTEETSNNLLPAGTYFFNALGKMVEPKAGFFNEEEGLRHYTDDVMDKNGLFRDGEDIYYAKSDGSIVMSSFYTVGTYKTNGILPAGTYYFGDDGKLTDIKNGFYNEEGVLRYYVNNVMKNNGLFQDGTDIYYAKSDGTIVVSSTYSVGTYKTNNLLPAGTYYFNEEGKYTVVEVKNGFKNEEGVLRYYDNGVMKNNGLFQVDEDIYYAKSDGTIVVSASYAVGTYKTNNILPAGTYYFGEDGKYTVKDVKNGFYNEEGVLRYYDNGVMKNNGLFQVGEDIYYAKSDGTIVVSASYSVGTYKTNNILPAGTYYFGEEGKLIIK